MISCLLCIIFTSCGSTQSKKNLEEKLTAHTWVFNWVRNNKTYYTHIFMFNKNGTFNSNSIEYDGEGRIEEETTDEGTWTLSEDKTLTIMPNDPEDTKSIKWNTDVTDADCEQLLNSAKYNSAEYKKENAFKDWHVSDSFFKIGYYVFTPQ